MLFRFNFLFKNKIYMKYYIRKLKFLYEKLKREEFNVLQEIHTKHPVEPEEVIEVEDEPGTWIVRFPVSPAEAELGFEEGWKFRVKARNKEEAIKKAQKSYETYYLATQIPYKRGESLEDFIKRVKKKFPR